MTKIHKKDHLMDITKAEDKPRRKCLYCEKYSIESFLTPRPNYDEIDKDMWLYCPHCHRTYLLNETRMEGRLKASVDAMMYEDEKTIMGLDNLAFKDKYQRQKKEILERLKKEKDPEVRELIKRGYDVQDHYYQ